MTAQSQGLEPLFISNLLYFRLGYYIFVVPPVGLEPTRPMAPTFEIGMSTFHHGGINSFVPLVGFEPTRPTGH
jgi:hypothetical protein